MKPQPGDVNMGWKIGFLKPEILLHLVLEEVATAPQSLSAASRVLAVPARTGYLCL